MKLTLKGNVLFDLLLVVFLAVIVVMSFDYNERARLIPLVIGIPSLAMMVMLFVADAFPSIGSRMSFVRSKGMAIDSASAQSAREEAVHLMQSNSKKEDEPGFSFRTCRVFAWLLFLTLLLLYVNYVYSIPLFIVLFMVLEAREKIVTSILTAAGMGIFVYILFGVLLQATF